VLCRGCSKERVMCCNESAFNSNTTEHSENLKRQIVIIRC
jgi:hypothetical protein